MATKKKEKTVQELLREKQLEQIENFSIDDGEEEHSLDQILEAASQQGLLELYNPFEERAKKIAEEEAQAPKRPSEAQTARQTFDQLGNLGNMVKKTETETLPKITNEAIKNYNLSKVGRDYLSKYDDSTSYADIKKDIAEVQSKRDEDSSKKDEYDLAFAMLNNYVNQKYDLNGTDLSQDAIKRRQEVYDYNQNVIDDLNTKVEANEGDTENLNLDDEEAVSKYLNHDKDAVDFFMGYRSGRITQDAANQEKYITMRNYIENAANSDSVRDLRNEAEDLRAQNAAYDRTQGQSDRYALQYGDEVKNEKTDLLAGTLHTRNNVPDNFDERVENGSDRFTDMGDISQPAIKRYGGENAVEDYNNMDAHTEMLTSEEKGIYSYLLRNEGEVSANAYLDSLKDVLQKRASETTQEYIDNASGAEKAVLLAASVPMNVYGTVTGFAEDAANIAAGKDIHPYSEAHSMYNIAQQTRSSVAEDIDEATNSWNVLGFSAGDAFQAAMSIPDFMLGSLTPSYYAASMSMGAAQSTAKELWEEGATNEQIVAESVLSGAAEYVFEKVSLDKILDTADKSKLVKSALAGMAIEGSEEANTEIANIISDVLVRGSQSEWHKAIQNYKDQGYSDSESQAKAFSDMAKRVGYSAIGGAIGGAGGGAGVAVEKGAGLIQNKSERNKYIASVGADVTNAGNTQALLDTADQMKDNAEVQAQAQKVRQAQTKNAEKGTESTAKTLSRETGKLYAAIQDSNAQGIQNAEASEIKAAIKQAYAAETGEDVKSDTVTQAAEAIYKSEYTGEKLTRAERNLASTSQAQSAVESVRNNPDLIESATQKAQERGFRDYVETAKLTQKQEQETKTDDDVDIAEFNYHEDDGKVYTSDGKKQVDIASVASIGDNDITFNLNDGQTESAKALDMPTNQAVLAQSILDVQKKIGVPLTADIANTLYQGYEQSDSPSVSAYMQDAQTVLFNGYANNTAPDSSIKLPQGLRNQLYSMGRQLAASHTQAQQQAVNNRVKGNKARKGSVTFVDGIRRGQLDARRRAGVDTVENLAKSLGFDVVFYRSTKNGKGRYSSEYVRKKEFTAEGQQAPSGFWRGGKMYLDINAGMNGEGLILFTASHELVHMIREGSPEDFKALADFLVKNYAEQGVNINDLVLKEMNKSTNLTRDEAFEEVIAESCETFLRDTHLNDKAQELYKQNPTLWSRIREALKRIINAIKEAYAVARPQSEEARITNRADIETLEKAYDLWTKGIIKSAENLRNMESNRTDTKYQGRAESTDAEYLDAVERGDMETAQRMVDQAAKAAGYTIKAYHGTARADRVGNVFRPERATSGPMAFFTDSKEIAGNYARDKADTSIAYDSDYDSYYTQFRVQRGNKTISISELWNTLPYPEKQKIKERAKHIKFDDDAENIIYDEKAQYGNGNVDDYTFNMHRGNALDVLVDSWLESGDLWGEEEKFLDVLKLSGVDGVEYFDPDFRDEKVYETYLNISNPYDTSTVDNDFIDRIEDWWSEQDEDEYYKESSGADMWDKNSMTVEDFVGRLREDLESKTSHAWTSIPDAITAFLKYEGYDGIKDTGGKSGGESHTVWIPFSSEQIKSADPVTYDDNGDVIPLSERFNESNKDIRYQSRSSTDNIAYKYAVKNKDTEKAQRLVERTANRVFSDSKVRGKDGKLRKVYHYTNTDFYSFDTGRSGRNQGQTHGDGIYISTSPDEFSYAGKKRMTLYANITNPFEMELTEEQARDVLEKYAVTKHNLDQYDGLYRNHAMNALQSPIKVFDYLKEYADDNGIKVSEILQDLGFDGVHDGSEWVAFSSKQLKSADPITYDDNGKVISLSQRFDTTKTDIRYQSRDDGLFSIDLSDDDTISDVAAREFVTHHEDMGEVLKNIADIDIEPKRVESIINRVSREHLGSLDAEAKHTLSIEIQLALERVNNTDAQTVSDTIIDAVRRAIEKGTVSDERAEANYKELFNAFKGKKFYLTDEQINQLKEHNMTLDSFRKAMFGKMTIVKRENAKRSINGGYADAQALSLEGLHDVIESADEVLGIRSWQWDQENYDAPYIIKKAFDDLNKLRNQSVSQIYSDQDIDDMAVAMSAKITGGIVEEKYKSKYKGKDSQQIRKALAAEQKQTDDYIANLVDKLMEKHEAELAEREQKLSELKQKERERANKREKELTEHYKEQRAKSVEKRNLTKQKNIVARKFRSLDQKLNRADKNKTVKEGLRPTAAKLLEVGNMLFPETRSLEQIAREGVADATPAEQKLLDRYVEYLDIREKTTTEEGRKHASAVLANIRKLLSNEGVMVEVTENGKTVKKKMSVTARERMRYDNAMRDYNGLKLKTALSELEDAYRTVKNSSLGYIADSYDPNIVESIQDLRDEVGNALAKDMTADQLKTLNDIITDTLTSIKNANKSFTQERSITDTANAVIRDIKNTRVLKDSRFTIPNKAGEFLAWNNFKPIYAMRYIGSDTFTDLFWKLQKGESDWYVDIAEAKEFKDNLDEKYGVGKLNTKKKTDFNYNKKATFTALDGSKFTLNLDQMMDIYASSRREQALQHLTTGGFTFAKDVKSDKRGKIQTGAKVYQLTMETIDKIADTLTVNEKKYVEEMQEYLSTVMADKGNEVSMQLHGLKLFNEETYWSISSTDIYAPQSDVDQEQKKDLVKKIRNAGFTKKTVKNASNPIVLQGFETKWSSHVNDMSLYHSMTLPLEDFTRVANYKERGQGATATTGVRGVLIQAYGNAASNYINQLIDDINGGIQQKMRVGLADNLVSLAKKGAVLNNLSVVIQQPSAVFRAMAYVDMRYFMLATGNKFWSYEDKQFTWNKHNKMYEELIKYAPVAGIKRMGSFDTGAGRGVIDYLSSGGNESLAKRAYNKGEDIASFLPEFADELAWLKLWQAIQHETKAKYGYKIGTEENKVKSGERFTEVVHLTQVYDSTLSRSQSMRGKDFGSKMLTSFMAEPTTYMNMAVDAVVQSKRTHNFKQLAKTMSALSLALIANALLVAIPRAMRDDDDDETFDEKYMQAFWDDIVSGVNPLNYFPVLKDVSSIVFENRDPSRMDLSVVSDTANTLKKAYKNIGNDNFTANDVIDIIGSVAAWGGISVKNLVRDIRSVINTAKTVKNPRYNKEVDKMGLSLPFAYQKAYDKAYDEGYSEEECKSKGENAARGKIREALKDKYLKALKESDSKTMSEIMRYMAQSGYYNKKGNTVDDTLKEWRKGSDESEKRAKVAEERKAK